MTGASEARVTQALVEFEAALQAMPFGQERLAKGQQFNAYECAENDEEGDPSDWEYLLCLGPITDAAFITRIDGEWRAKLIETALRVALHQLRHRQSATAPLIEALEAAREVINATLERGYVSVCIEEERPDHDALTATLSRLTAALAEHRGEEQ